MAKPLKPRKPGKINKKYSEPGLHWAEAETAFRNKTGNKPKSFGELCRALNLKGNQALELAKDIVKASSRMKNLSSAEIEKRAKRMLYNHNIKFE